MKDEETNKSKHWAIALGLIGLVLCFGGFICDIISDFSSLIPDSDWYRMAILIGWSTSVIAQYFSPITDKNIKNGDSMWWIVIVVPLIVYLHIDHYTVPIIAATVVGSILLVVAFVLARKRHFKIKALQEQQEEGIEDN